MIDQWVVVDLGEIPDSNMYSRSNLWERLLSLETVEHFVLSELPSQQGGMYVWTFRASRRRSLHLTLVLAEKSSVPVFHVSVHLGGMRC